MSVADQTPMPNLEPEVLVIGLGPVGVTLCNLLGQAGISVAAIDSRSEIYPLPRAIGMDHDVMRVMQNIGVADELAPFMAPFRPSEYRSADGTLLRRLDSPPEPYPQSWPPYLTFVQPELERVLRDNLSRFPNISVRLGTEAVAISGPEDPEVIVRGHDCGDTETIRPRYVVGCDGANSFVRRSFDVALEDLGFEAPWLVVDVILDSPVDTLPETNVQFCNPARPHTFVVLPGRLRRWEFMLLPGEDPAEMNRPVRIWELLSTWLTPDEATLWRSATYTFRARVAEEWRRGGVFLAGDASHTTPPFLAQGMVQGVKDASNLAWKLAAVLKGAPDRLLDSYSEERRPFVHQVISTTIDLGKLICELDPDKAAKRDEELEAAMREGRGQLVRQDLFPPIRGGVLARSADCSISAGAGEPAPQPWLITDGDRTRLDDAMGADFRLLITGSSIDETGLEKRAEGLGVRICRIGPIGDEVSGPREMDGVLQSWLDRHDASAVLVRPDHVVFGSAGDRRDIDSIFDQLEQFLLA